ncbi:uncharacterized protein LOC142355838 isoform X1 [Convolutriloba macropyga]|uniref:uncharacterized protein LOC142355838 isoform X1 n=1 Tax=Convolutriloba macropyga TaxID=536237 RepID=UPI003F51C1BF
MMEGRSGNRGVPTANSPGGGLNASEGGNSISSMNYPPPQTVGFLGQVIFPTNNERDRYDTTYILMITHSGRAVAWSAKTDDRTGSVDLDDSRDSSRECCVCNFMQVEMLNCYSKPTDEAFAVFRSIEHAPEDLCVQTVGMEEKQRLVLSFSFPINSHPNSQAYLLDSSKDLSSN